MDLPLEVPGARWVVRIIGDTRDGKSITPDTQLLVYAPGVSPLEVARVLLDVGTKMLGMPLGQALPTQADAVENKRRADVLKDYPARYVNAAAGVYLCLACEDLYAKLLDGPTMQLPSGGPSIACAYHLDPSKAPCSFDEAAKIMGETDPDAIDATDDPRR